MSELYVYFTCARERTHTRTCTHTPSSREVESRLIWAGKEFFSWNQMKNKTSFSPAQNPSLATHYSKPPPTLYTAIHVLVPPLFLTSRPASQQAGPLLLPWHAMLPPASGLLHTARLKFHIYLYGLSNFGPLYYFVNKKTQTLLVQLTMCNTWHTEVLNGWGKSIN